MDAGWYRSSSVHSSPVYLCTLPRSAAHVAGLIFPVLFPLDAIFALLRPHYIISCPNLKFLSPASLWIFPVRIESPKAPWRNLQHRGPPADWQILDLSHSSLIPSSSSAISTIQGPMEDPDGVWACVAQCIEQLRTASSTTQQKEALLKKLLDLMNARENARIAVSWHPQSMSMLVTMLRSGSINTRSNAAMILGVLCNEEEMRIKVLLGGSIPPLLALLKSTTVELQVAAARALYAASKGGDEDKVGPKIFSTEGAVPYLWQQLISTSKITKQVEGILAGALRNLSRNPEGFWEATSHAGGLEILLRMISSGSSEAQCHSCYLLANMMMIDESTCPKVMHAGCVERLLRLLSPGNDLPVRAEAAGALKALSSKSSESRRLIVGSNGTSTLVSATVAPCKEGMGGELAQALQENAMCALANVSGGLHSVIYSLAKSLTMDKSDLHIADTLGALASALMIFRSEEESTSLMDPLAMEQILAGQIQPNGSGLIQERAVEALASLYGNTDLASCLSNSEAKRMLVGLITMASFDVQEEFLKSFKLLCSTNADLWNALQQRHGVQLLISLLGVSTEEQQDCTVSLLSLLCQENDESKWAITAAGGIPPLVQILETGSPKAKEDSAAILGNLCKHSEDIRSCVERAGAVPAFLLLLKNASVNGQDIAARYLKHLVSKSDAATVSQLNAMLTGDIPESKSFVLDTLMHFLSVSALTDILFEGSAANESFCTLIRMLGSFKEEAQQQAASVLARLLKDRKDLRESPTIAEIIAPLYKILTIRNELVAKYAAQCLAALFISIRQNDEVAEAARKTVEPLLRLCMSTNIEVAEQAISALANLFQDSETAEKAAAEELIQPITRVLREGTLEGKMHAAGAFSRIIHKQKIDDSKAERIHLSGTVLALMALLAEASAEDEAAVTALEALASLARSNRNGACSQPPLSTLAKTPQSIGPLVQCLATGQNSAQNKAIEVLSRLCKDQPVVLGDTVAHTSRCIDALADRVIAAPSTEVQIGAVSLLICTAKEHREHTMKTLMKAECLVELIQSLVKMIGIQLEDTLLSDEYNTSNELGDADFMTRGITVEHLQTEVKKPEVFLEKSPLGKTVALWLLSILATYDSKGKSIIAEAGAIEAIIQDLEGTSPYNEQDNVEDTGNTWVSALLLAVLFQERDVIHSSAVIRAIPVLANLLKSEEPGDRYFAAQAVASLASNGSRGTILAVANSGAPVSLIALLGTSDSDTSNLLDLVEEFSLIPNPVQIVLEHLFRIDDIRMGSTARKVIPALVELLKPSAERPGAPLFAQGLLRQLATGSHANKIAMAEAGVLEALTRYLSLGPQDNMEECTSDLMRILFNSPELRCHESAMDALNQLVAVLRLGGRGARYNAGRALQGLFAADYIKNSDSAKQAIPPLMEMLRKGSEKEQRVALKSLSRLSEDNPPKAMIIADPESKCLEILCNILWADCSLELKEETAELCFVLFGNSRVRANPAAASCIEPLVMLLSEETRSTWLAVVHALNNLMDSPSLVDIAVTYSTVPYIVKVLTGDDHSLHEAAISALIKLGTDRTNCKLDMVKYGVIERIVQILPILSNFACASAAELLRILTNHAAIAKGVSASVIVEPLLSILSRPSLSIAGQHSTMQVLINILEKPEQLAKYKPSPSQPIEPLILLLDSPSQTVQQLAAELFSHFLVERHLEPRMITEKVVISLVQLVGTGGQSMQQKAVLALENASNVLPQAVAEAGGITEVSKIVLQLDPLPPHELWEAASSVLRNILQNGSLYIWHVPIEAFVRMLQSDNEATIVAALQGMLALERDPASAEAFARSGAIDALVELLRCHQCEEATAQVLEALLSDKRVRNMKTAQAAIAPLAHYLLDPHTQNRRAQLLAALSLGDLFQRGGQSLSSTDATLACQGLINLFEYQPPEDTRTVALSALQNVITNSRVNRRTLAESGAVDLVRDLLCSGNRETVGQAATLTKLLFSNQTTQEHASSDIIRALSVALLNELSHDSSINVDVIKAIALLFTNFPKLREADAATLCIPHLAAALKAGSDPVQDTALETLFLLRQAWPGMTADGAKAQSLAMAEAIPILQGLIKSGTPRFHERASSLLLSLPGNLVVTIKQGKNLKQSLGSTNAFCKLTLGNGPTKETKVVSHSTAPEWNQGFAWEFDAAPKGQKVHIACKNKGIFSKGSLGRVTIQVDRVVALGTVIGDYTLQPDKNRDGTPRVLVIEITWSNR